MAFRFQKASCVVAGTFNMYILHPQWLTERGIIESGLEFALQANLAQPGFRFTLEKHAVTWRVEPNRIIVDTRDARRDCGADVAQVLTALPHTPLFGIGNNVVYEADSETLEALKPEIRSFPWAKPLDDDEAVEQKTFHIAVRQTEHGIVNLQLAIKKDTLELSCNAHTKLEDRSDANQVAIAAAKRFFDDRAYCETQARHFFGVAIDQ